MVHEIDYKIYGNEMQFVEIELEPRGGVIAESGSMMMMMMDNDITKFTV